MAEIETAVRRQLPVVIIIGNDGVNIMTQSTSAPALRLEP
jgi:hypothetical protein